MLKKILLETLLQHSKPWVAVDTTFPGVDLPKHLQGIVNFRMFFDQGPQIPDLELTSEGWTATLNFGPGNNHFVKVPWGACVQFSDGRDHTFAIIFTSEKPTLKDLPPVRKLGLVKNEKS